MNLAVARVTSSTMHVGLHAPRTDVPSISRQTQVLKFSAFRSIESTGQD